MYVFPCRLFPCLNLGLLLSPSEFPIQPEWLLKWQSFWLECLLHVTSSSFISNFVLVLPGIILAFLLVHLGELCKPDSKEKTSLGLVSPSHSVKDNECIQWTCEHLSTYFAAYLLYGCTNSSLRRETGPLFLPIWQFEFLIVEFRNLMFVLLLALFIEVPVWPLPLSGCKLYKANVSEYDCRKRIVWVPFEHYDAMDAVMALLTQFWFGIFLFSHLSWSCAAMLSPLPSLLLLLRQSGRSYSGSGRCIFSFQLISAHGLVWIWCKLLLELKQQLQAWNCRRTWEWLLCLNFGRNFSPVLELDQLGENPRQMIRTSRACFVAAGKQVIRWSFYCWVTWLKSIPTEVLMLIMAL